MKKKEKQAVNLVDLNGTQALELPARIRFVLRKYNYFSKHCFLFFNSEKKNNHQNPLIDCRDIVYLKKQKFKILYFIVSWTDQFRNLIIYKLGKAASID